MRPSHISTMPFPTRIIDEAMPALTDTAWRVLVIVVRQTFGWRDGKQNIRNHDWLSHQLLKAKSGRESAALSNAIDHLVKRGLIESGTETGYVLKTRFERRRYKGRVYFRLSPTYLAYLSRPKSGS